MLILVLVDKYPWIGKNKKKQIKTQKKQLN